MASHILEVAQTDPNPAYSAWVARCAAARDEQRAERERRAANESLRMSAYIKPPTREERAAQLRSDIYIADAALADLDNTQRWGRWTQDEFAAKCRPHWATKALAMALLADLEGVQ